MSKYSPVLIPVHAVFSKAYRINQLESGGSVPENVDPAGAAAGSPMGMIGNNIVAAYDKAPASFTFCNGGPDPKFTNVEPERFMKGVVPSTKSHVVPSDIGLPAL